MEELEVMYFNETEQEHYESQQRRYLDEDALAKQEERKIQSAIHEAVLDNNLEIARKMKAKGKPMDEITDFTGLTQDQIEKL